MTRSVAAFLPLVILVCCGVSLQPRAATAEVVILDGDDVTDWVRVHTTGTWKYKDTCLYPTSLLKFGLTDIPIGAEIQAAELRLFVERADPGRGIESWHVDKDGWSYGMTHPDSLQSWPVLHSMGSQSFSDTGAVYLDVTSHLIEELAATSGEISIKITEEAVSTYPDIRLASPLAASSRMRPRILVEYQMPISAVSMPDLSVYGGDIRFSKMRPQPGETVRIDVAVRNLGPGDASNVPVAFFKDTPDVGVPIGVATIPLISGGGGEGTASVNWNSIEGVSWIYAVVDQSGSIPETDETNNEAFRSYLVAPVDGYETSLESFEYGGNSDWHTDWEVPKQFTYPGPKSFYLTRSGAEAYHGRYAMELFLDGTADDGTIWLERSIPVEPFSTVDVGLSFELFRYGADIAFFPVASVSPLDPEVERDFEFIPVPSQPGWVYHSFEKTVDTGPYDQVHVGLGLTVAWETPGSFFMDLVSVSATQPTTGVAPPAPGETPPQPTLLQNRPNPMGPLTTIAFRLDRPGPVTLRIYDASGRFVVTLRDGPEKAGEHRVHWQGVDGAGRAVPPGVYFYELRTAAGTESRKLMLVR